MSSPPDGTVTFMFTDIQGSTALWETNPDLMRQALRQHDELVREAIVAHGGFVVKTVGDSFRGAFTQAVDALRAALAAQRALAASSWPEATGPLLIRVAMHTGSAEYRDGDYYGQALNRVARLEAAGHGGQILVSGATQALLRDDLPEAVTLRDLGQHHLKDLLQPERIFQVVADGLPADFPPLNTLESSLNNLPGQLTPFIGRERELTAVLNLLRREDVRLVTLTGPGGTGKTRLSLAAAADLLDDFADGVWFVDLSPLQDPDLVLPTIAAALGVREVEGRSIAEALRDYLADRQLLLVLDNFEQVVDAAPAVGELLAAAPALKALASSREVLRVYGEHVYPVPPLGLPEPGQRHQTAAILSEYEAVRLFIQRAQAASASFRFDESSAADVAAICQRVDGLPLAIELAAARCRMLSPETIRKGLHSRLKMLTGGPRDLPARQQTIRQAIEWSTNLLDPDEQRLFARLGVFNGGCTMEAAEAVCGEALSGDVFTLIESLLDKSLIRQEVGHTGAPRFSMLETIREYALERLEAAGERADLAERHALYFQDYSQELVERVRERRESADAAVDLMDDDFNNFRAALAWCLSPGLPGWQAGRVDVAAFILSRIIVYWFVRQNAREGAEWAEKAIALLPEGQEPDLTHARLFYVGASMPRFQGGDVNMARQRAEESVAIFREVGDLFGLGQAILSVGVSAALQGDLTAARAALAECITISRELDFIPNLVTAMIQLGNTYLPTGEFETAARYYHDVLSLDNLQEFFPSGVGEATANLGEIARCQGDYERAKGYYAQVLQSIEAGAPGDVGRMQHNLGFVALYEGDLEEARMRFAESLNAFQARTHPRGLMECAAGIGALALLRGDPELGAALMAASEAFFASMNTLRWPADREDFRRYWELAQEELGSERFADAQQRGAALSQEEAVVLAESVLK
jgi:predicted ATPase/class 3 adenylate cyclase